MDDPDEDHYDGYDQENVDDPPMVYDDTIPSAHMTSKIIATVFEHGSFSGSGLTTMGRRSD